MQFPEDQGEDGNPSDLVSNLTSLLKSVATFGMIPLVPD